MPIEKGLIGYQDISFGTDTFQRKSQSGQLITLDQIRASHMPILDSAGRFTGTDIEAALAETMTREESGSTVKKLTNRSGAQRVAGDVVIIDTSNDDSFTTTSTASDINVLGVVLETIENLATGRVATGGYVATVKVNGSTTRGQFLTTSSTTLKARSVSLPYYKGIFAKALSNGSSTVSAFLFGMRAPTPFFQTISTALANDDTVSGDILTSASTTYVLADVIIVSVQYYAEYNGGNATDILLSLTKTGTGSFSWNGSSQQKPVCGGTLFDLMGAGQYIAGTISAILLCSGAGTLQITLNTTFTGTSPRWKNERTSMSQVVLPYLLEQ